LVPHPAEHGPADRPLQQRDAAEIADTMRALGTPGRLQVLFALLAGERTVEELARSAGLGQSATSHHLRLLRSLRMVAVRRDGRHAIYSLYDHHIADLLAAVRHHQEHVHPPAPVALPSTARSRVRR
jgi:ArsR family transcriptional regulator, nickel/cobalt-responsive transcriptional repressor